MPVYHTRSLCERSSLLGNRQSIKGEGEKRSNALFLASGQIQQEVASSKESQRNVGGEEEESGKERDSEIVKVVALSLILAGRILDKKNYGLGNTAFVSV